MYTLEQLENKSLKELKEIGWELNVLPEGDRRYRESWINAIAGVNPPLLQLLETFPAVSVEQAQEPPIESKFGRIVYPRPAQGAISRVAKTSPGVEVDRVQDIINKTWTSWEKEHCAWLKNAKWCIHHGENKRIEAFLPVSKTLRLEGMKKGTGYCAIWEVSECTYDFNGFPLPVCSSLYEQGLIEVQAQEPIVSVAKTSPGVEADRVEEPFPECSECFGDGYVEDASGFIRCCSQCLPENKSEQRVSQSAIAQVAKTSPGVTRKTSTAHQLLELFKSSAHIIPDSPAETEAKVRQSVIGQTESDQNPILTGCTFSDEFLARYSPPQTQNFHFQSDADGQLNLLDFEVESTDEPPDPDDFESIDAFREAMARWDWEHPSSFDHCSDLLPSSVHSELNSVHSEPPDPHDFDSMFAFWAAYDAWDEASDDDSEPLEISLDSFCEWAPCPPDWYEPIALLEPSKVLEMSPARKSSITSDFFIPTFDRWGDRANRQTDTDEPPDTGIFARLPKPKPPKFPSQSASWTQVGRKLDTSWTQVSEASRNYPETIPKLFHRVVAGSSTQPARSPPGGDANFA